jgi:transcriptional regulator with GAF, ATPase, and Fis domain
MASDWHLIVTRAGKRLHDRFLGLGVWTIGRSATNSIVLDDGEVSRFHALLTVDREGRCELRDLGSRNRTEMNGRAVTRQRLNPGDAFAIGGFELRVGVDALDESEGRGAHDEPATLGSSGAAGAVEPPLSEEPDAFLGTSPAARDLLARARRAASTDFNLLVTGETGAGKGVLSRLVHRWSARAARPFVVVNCAAIPGELVESELFGHRKGAFTGAIGDRAGKFRAAAGGTLLLDEIGDLALAAQAKILRAIEEREIEPVGETAPVAIDVRMIAATNQDLEKLVAQGRFRLDLHHRLSTLTLHVPPLCERPEDVVTLANWFLGRLVDEVPSAGDASFSSEAIDALVAHRWPGNVRELRNVVAYALLEKEGDVIRPADLRFPRSSLARPAVAPGATLGEAESRHVVEALERHGWNLAQTARALGISRNTLKGRIEKWGLSRPGGTERKR